MFMAGWEDPSSLWHSRPVTPARCPPEGRVGCQNKAGETTQKGFRTTGGLRAGIFHRGVVVVVGGDLLPCERRSATGVFYFQFHSQPRYSLPASPSGSDAPHPVHRPFPKTLRLQTRRGAPPTPHPAAHPLPVLPAGPARAPPWGGKTRRPGPDPLLLTRPFPPLRTSTAPASPPRPGQRASPRPRARPEVRAAPHRGRRGGGGR